MKRSRVRPLVKIVVMRWEVRRIDIVIGSRGGSSRVSNLSQMCTLQMRFAGSSSPDI
jgi:hypothetical protein